MKALIRNKYETITEDMNVSGLDWKTGAPLTNPWWAGGPYTMVTDYVPPPDPVEGSEDTGMQSPGVQSTPSATQDAEALPETVLYGGKEYTLEELKKLIG